MSYLPDLTLLGIVGATIAWSHWRRYETDRTVFLLFVAIATAVFYPNYPDDSLSGFPSVLGRFRVRELLMVALFLALMKDMWKGRRRKFDYHTTSVALVMFLSLAAFSGLIRWLEGAVGFARVLRDLHPLLFTSLVMIIPTIVTSRRDLGAFLRLLAVFSLLVLTLTPAQIALLPQKVVFLPGVRPEAFGDEFLLLGWTWAGLALANAFVFVGLCHGVMGMPFKGGRLLTTALISIGVTIVASGFTRMNWIAHTVAAVIMLLVVPLRVKCRFALGLTGVAAAVVLIFSSLVLLLPDAGERSVARIEFLFSTMLDSSQYHNTAETGERTSVGRRLMENQIAWDVFTHNPILGAGLGYKYWENVTLFTPSGDRVSLRNIYVRGGAYIHNSWFWLLSKIGLFGTLAFAWAFIMPFARGLCRSHLLLQPVDQAVACGFGLRGLAMLFESIAHPYFLTVATAAGLGTMAGTAVALFNLAQYEHTNFNSLDHHSQLQRRAWHSLPLGAGFAGDRETQ